MVIVGIYIHRCCVNTYSTWQLIWKITKYHAISESGDSGGKSGGREYRNCTSATFSKLVKVPAGKLPPCQTADIFDWIVYFFFAVDNVSVWITVA